MSFSAPELARRPFANLRPVRRATVLMWVLGGLVLAFNLWFYGTHFSTLSHHHERLETLDGEVQVAGEQVAELDSELAGLNLDWQNRQVILLNNMIDQRTFSWSGLIDHLTDVLPPKVRLFRLTPRISGDRKSQRGLTSEESLERRVVLTIGGSADNGEALLQFIDALFVHPRFEGPVLSGESRGNRGEISSFGLTVSYLPDELASSAEAEQEEPPAAGGEPLANDQPAAAEVAPEAAP